MKVYKVENYSSNIYEMNAIRETEHFYFIKLKDGSIRRQRKFGYYEKIFKKWSNARDYLVERINNKIVHSECELERLKQQLKVVLSLKQE